MENNSFNPIHVVQEVTILNGNDTSDFIDTKGATFVGIETPAALTGANLSFEISNDSGANFKPYFNASGNVVSIPIGTDRVIGLVAADFAPVQFLRLVSDATEAADRTFKIIMRPV